MTTEKIKVTEIRNDIGIEITIKRTNTEKLEVINGTNIETLVKFVDTYDHDGFILCRDEIILEIKLPNGGKRSK